MRWVERGPEPPGLLEYRLNLTQEWVDYYCHLTGDKPTAQWARFRDDLGHRFNHLCGYCERACDRQAEDSGRSATLDHFRPRSRFPKQTYEWTNWVFSCRRCNDHKQDKWPVEGFVDPCAPNCTEHPERFLDYDHVTGEVMPKSGISPDNCYKANHTINDLMLNDLDLRVARMNWIDQLTECLDKRPHSEWPAIFERFTNPSAEFGGITRMFLAQYHQPGH